MNTYPPSALAGGPVPGMQAIDADTMMGNNIGPLSYGPWDQWWWSAGKPDSPSPSQPMHHAYLHAQGDLQLQDFMSSYAASYPTADPAPASPADSPTSSLGTPDDGRRSSSASQSHPEQRKRRRQSAAGRPAKPRRDSSKSKPEEPAETTSTRRKSLQQEVAAPSPQEQRDNDDPKDRHTRRIQERNRIASTKFRVKKREDAKRLQLDEEDMERINKDLTSCVAELTLEVYQLKMRLLQHTDCECTLIQNYIANEANRYISDMRTDQQQQQQSNSNTPHH